MALVKILNVEAIPLIALVIPLILLFIILILKQPISNIIMGNHELFHGKKSEYFVEQGVGLIEVVISMFSNTMSFLRVGSFAISHAALFLAFSIIAEMTGSMAGSIIIYIIANIIAIGLEGLVVLIQCLRLEFYELFSRYYKGNSNSYDPIRIKNKI